MNRKCPYCGNYGVEILGLYWAWCPECGAEGPKMDTEREAWGAWDRVVNAIKTDDCKVATDTDVGHEIPLPVKRDERGPVREKTVKELFAKIDEELTEFKAAVLAVLNLDDTPSDLPTGIYPVIADEAVDSITAIVTNCEALGIDADARAAAIARCNRRNLDRGRL